MGPNGLVSYVQSEFRWTHDEQACCGSPSRRREAPDIRRDRQGWFDFWDEDRSGTLDKQEIIRAFLKTFGRQQSAENLNELRMLIEVMWPEFDPDGSQSIDRQEFCQPGEGLADFILANLPAGAGPNYSVL